MDLRVNGDMTRVEDGGTLADLLHQLNVTAQASGIAVAVNETVVPKQKWDTTDLHAGDAVEIIHAVQGG